MSTPRLQSTHPLGHGQSRGRGQPHGHGRGQGHERGPGQGVSADKVIELLNRLQTRLPRLQGATDDPYLVMARVMEFQKKHKLEPNGIIGAATLSALRKSAQRHTSKASPPFGQVVVVNLNVWGNQKPQTLTAYESGKPADDLKDVPCFGGSLEYPSHRGVFRIFERHFLHTSSAFPYPLGNMNFALRFHGGEAIHAGPVNKPSHACIHVNGPSTDYQGLPVNATGNTVAEKLFKWADLSTMVIVLGLGKEIGLGHVEEHVEKDEQGGIIEIDRDKRLFADHLIVQTLRGPYRGKYASETDSEYLDDIFHRHAYKGMGPPPSLPKPRSSPH
jgi:hypothetical protein